MLACNTELSRECMYRNVSVSQAVEELTGSSKVYGSSSVGHYIGLKPCTQKKKKKAFQGILVYNFNPNARKQHEESSRTIFFSLRQLGLHREFQDSQGRRERPCLKKS